MSVQSSRITKSAGTSLVHLDHHGAHRPMTTNNVIDKNSIIWKDFMYGVKKRKALVQRLKDAALENINSQSMLKRLLLELRQTTLRLIEDALEIEFRSQLYESKVSTTSKRVQLPPVSSFRKIEEKEDILALSEIITDVDDLFKIPNIRVMLPMEFPSTRNPFLLGKSVDELAYLVPPHPEPGNVEIELKVLELMRYKRAAKALIRAEAQTLNRLPITLQDVEAVVQRAVDNLHLEKLLRCVCALLDNDGPNARKEADLRCIQNPMFNVEAHDLLLRINRFQGITPVRFDVQTSVRQLLRECVFDFMDEDEGSSFLLEWLNTVLGKSQFKETDKGADSRSFDGSSYPLMGELSQHDSRHALIQPGRAVSPLTQKNLIQHNFYDDMTSVVPHMDDRGTHEGIYVEPPEILKIKPTTPGAVEKIGLGAVKPGSRGAAGAVSAGGRAMPPKPVTPKTTGASQRAPQQQPLRSSVATGTSAGGVVLSAAQRAALLAENPLAAEEVARANAAAGHRRIRSEVERIIKEMGFEKGGASRNVDSDKEVENTMLNSLRFELFKMQQELLRRQVLDPRHYKLESIDTVDHRGRGLTDIHAFGQDGRRRTQVNKAPLLGGAAGEDTFKQITIANKSVMRPSEVKSTVSSSAPPPPPDKMILEVVVNLVNNTVNGLIFMMVEMFDGYETVTKKTSIASIEFSRLIYNRLTNYVFDELIDVKPELKGRMLQNIFDQLESRALEVPLPRGRLLAIANRVLLNSVFTEDGVLIDMVICRNDECNGLLIHCTPLSGLGSRVGQVNSGPVTVSVSDAELLILLVNHHGMYELSRIKWASMESVAQWLSSRLIVKKVRAADNNDSDSEGEEEEEGEEGELLNLDNKSVNSQLSFDENSHDERERKAAAVRRNSQQQLAKAMESGAAALSDDRPAPPVVYPSTTRKQRKKKPLMMLDVKIDRRVEVSKSVMLQWISRNVPSIFGVEVRVHAFQDLEMFVINVIVLLPNDRTTGFEAVKGESDSENEDQEDREEIHLTYRLTSAEIACFGHAQPVEKKKISMSNNTKKVDEDHPEIFMWNIFRRLTVHFKGSNLRPFADNCSAVDSNNWSISFNRLLVREVKTVSKRLIVLSVTATGNELLVESEAVNSTDAKSGKIGSKNLSELDLTDLVHAEGLPVSLLEYSKRNELASQVLSKLKIVDVGGVNRLELESYAECKMIKIVLFTGAYNPEVELGHVEINMHSTLSDLRVLIKNELDMENLPSQFRFLYKGNSCSVKQEPFRRAWECLPKCTITPKILETNEISVETDDILLRRMKEQGDKMAIDMPKLIKGQRRVAGKYAVMPVSTLCQVQEGRATIFLLHDAKDLLQPGDIIRIGNILGRDYIVAAPNRNELNSYPKTVKIEPEYDLLEENAFNTPTQFNFAYPKQAGILMTSTLYSRPINLLKSPKQLGFEYELTDQAIEAAGGLVAAADPADAGGVVGSPEKSGGKSPKKAKSKKFMMGNQTFFDCWLWKCVPLKEDRRLKWRQLYDDGYVKYSYEHTNSLEVERHFRVPIGHPYLEILVTDSRCPQLTYHPQRVNEMVNIPIDTYTKLAFHKMTDWQPQYKKGIDRTKFIKLMKDVTAFPDLRRPARVAQLDMYFAKEVKSENGIVQKYITYAGFCRLLQDIALIRFPPKRRIKSKAEVEEAAKRAEKAGGGAAAAAAEEEGEDEDDETSIGAGEMDDLASINSLGSNEEGGGGAGGKKRPAKPGGAGHRGKAGKKSGGGKDGKGGGKAGAAAEEEQPEKEAVINPAHIAFAFQKFVLDFVMMYPDWYDVIWAEAKLMAMKKAAIPYCAATRIAAKHRGGIERAKYKFFLRNLIILQANVRRKLSAKKTHAFIDLLREDWCFRMRYHNATIIQAIGRRYIKRCWYFKIMQKVKEEQILIQKARRFRLKKLRLAAKSGAIYKEAKRVNGVMVFIKLTRKDARSYTKDFGIIIEIYAPTNQQKHVFVLEEPELRAYMMIELGVDSLSVGDLLDKRNLQKMVSSRLLIHKPTSKYGTLQVIFSKHALGQRGQKTLSKGKRVGKHFFVCKLFETVDEIAVQCYHPLTCKVFTCTIEVSALNAWIAEEHLIQQNRMALVEGFVPTPVITREKNKTAYYKFILDHLAVDTRKGTFKVLFSNQLLKSQKMQMVVKIQAAMRRALVRPRIVKLLDKLMLKVQVSAFDPTVYYVNRKTGASSWDKPKLLGPCDLPTEPVRKWVKLTYNDNGATRVHYVNPFTGQYTSLVPDQAARKIQAIIRNYLLRTLAMPHVEFVKAGRIYKLAKAAYEANPNKLAPVINYAMTTHLIDLDEPLAKRLYGEAVDLSEANPLVTRAYAFFLMGTCEAPVAMNRERASLLLFDAKRKDNEHAKFQTAYYLFKFGALRKPNDIRALLNLALVQCILYENNYNAEKLLRRALAKAPFDERVMEIWKYLKDRFPERQLAYNAQARILNEAKVKGKTKIIHGRPCLESTDWAGWVFVETDTFNVSKVNKGLSYWYNPADGTESITMPDWKEQWLIRKNRSHYTEYSHGLELYYDPYTSEYFQYHALTESYSS